MTFFTSTDDLRILGDEVKRKLVHICNGERGFEHFPLRAGIFRSWKLRLHGRRRVMRTNRYLPTIDGMAHLLTLEYDDCDLFRRSGIRDIVLLPELILSESALLSHIFLPVEGILACYLYPARLNRPQQPLLAERFVQGLHRKPGLLQAVIHSLPSPAINGTEQGGESIIHKFIITRDEIKSKEVQAMEEIALHYSLSIHYENI